MILLLKSTKQHTNVASFKNILFQNAQVTFKMLCKKRNRFLANFSFMWCDPVLLFQFFLKLTLLKMVMPCEGIYNTYKRLRSANSLIYCLGCLNLFVISHTFGKLKQSLPGGNSWLESSAACRHLSEGL